MVAISLGDSAKKEKPLPEAEVPPIDQCPNLQPNEKCHKNGRHIFCWTILIEGLTLGLFIRLIYSLWTFHHIREIMALSFFIVGGIIFGFSNTLAYQAYYKNKQSCYARLPYWVLRLLMLMNIIIVILIWTAGFDELMERSRAFDALFGLLFLIPLQYYAIVVWEQISKELASGADYKMIKFFDQAKKWGEELMEELWTIEPGTKSFTQAKSGLSANIYHQRVIKNWISIFGLTFAVELSTFVLFITMIRSIEHGYIGCHRTLLTWVLSLISAYLFITTNLPALCAYIKTQKHRHVARKIGFLCMTYLGTGALVIALWTYLNFMGLFFSISFTMLVPFQVYCTLLWVKIGEEMAKGKDYKIFSIFSIFDCRDLMLELQQQEEDLEKAKAETAAKEKPSDQPEIGKY